MGQTLINQRKGHKYKYVYRNKEQVTRGTWHVSRAPSHNPRVPQLIDEKTCRLLFLP